MVSISKIKDISIIDVSFKSIDLEALEELRAEGEKLFSSSCFKIVMNLQNVNYLSSTGLGLLVYFHNKCNQNGGGFAVYGLQEYTLDMIKLTKLDMVLKILESRNEAIQALS